jgi:hypothetical protein
VRAYVQALGGVGDIVGAGGGLSAETVNFSYDSAGQATSMGGTWAYADSVSYTELGQPLQFQMGSSAESAWLTDNYDALGHLQSAARRALLRSLLHRTGQRKHGPGT